MRTWIPAFLQPAPAPPPPPPPADPPAAPPRAVQESVVDSVPVTYMESRIPEVDSAFGYGHLDGRRGVEPESFRAFIHHSVDAEGVEQRLEELRAREQALRDRATAVRERRAELAGAADALRSLREHRERCDAALDEARARLERAETSDAEHRDRGSYSQAAMFLVAGALFIFGDVVMTRKIVADALQLTGHRVLGIDESWIFAAGLAMISVVLKPAYDRLVEKPYWQGREKAFVSVIVTLAVASIATLYVLGDFRADAYASQQRVLMLQEAPGITEADRGRRIDALNEEMLGNPMAAVSFILSGILFAAAGAVTLSIGMRYARAAVHERRPARRQLTDARAVLAEARAAQDGAAAELAVRSEALERERTRAADDPAPLELDARADDLAEERRMLRAQWVETRQLRLGHLYDDGYDLGARLRADAEAEEAARRAEAARARPRRKRPRPFLALRRSIRQSALTSETLN